MYIKNNKGFSLIEILAAMALVGILTAIAVPAYTNYRSGANETVLKSDLGNGYKAYHAYNVMKGNYCADLGGVGLSGLINSSTYTGSAGGFVGFAGKESDCTTPINISGGHATVPNMPRSSCKLGSSTFKMAAINKFAGNEVGFSVSNASGSPVRGGSYCSKSSSDNTPAGAGCETQPKCIDKANDCDGNGDNSAGVGHWRTAGNLCQ